MRAPALSLAIALTVSGAPALAGDLTLDTDAIDAVFARYDHDDGPGCALGIIHDGELVVARGYGMASLEHGIPNGPRSVFRIGSTAKQFTAACAALAEQEGHLSLEDDIREHLPEMPDYGEPITIRNLLNHTSGIRDYLGLMGLSGLRTEDYYDDDALAMIARQRELNFAPGTQHLYSNSGYFLISVILHRATGVSLVAFARTRIFEPLGMRDTHYHDSHRIIVPRRSEGYSPGPDGRWEIDRTTLPMVGDGGVFTTVEDLLLWDRNFYEPTVGGEALLEALHTQGVLDDGSELDYALGLGIDTYRGLRVVAHGGAFVGYRAEMMRFPDERVSIICLGNTSAINPSALCRDVAEVILAGSFLDDVPTPVSAAAEAPADPREPFTGAIEGDLSGVYMGEADGAIFEIETDPGGVQVASGGRVMRLVALTATSFAPKDARVPGGLTFERATDEVPWTAHLDRGNGPQRLSLHIPWDSAFMSIEDYAGRYYSPELDAWWTLEPTAVGLTLSVAGSPWGPAAPLGLDRFESAAGQIVFERDPFHELTGFRLQSGRVQNLHFARKSD